MALVDETIASGNTKSEMIRRLRLGDLRKLLRDRYGPILPDDDAGRADLIELLLPISLGPEPNLKMRNAIEVWCPWMGQKETGEIIDQINQMPLWQRKPKAELLGQRLGLIYPDRTRLRIKTIAPTDVSREGMLRLRKQRDKERKRRQRQLRGAKSQTNSDSRNKPWQVRGISRATYYRQRRETISSTIKLPTVTEQTVSPQQRPLRKKEKESAERKQSIPSINQTPQSQKAVMPVTDTANELNGQNSLTTDADMIGHNGAPSLDTVADTANELLAPTCLNPELSAWNDPNCPVSLEYVPDGPERDLRGMPKDLSHYYKSAAVLDWSVSAQRHRLNKLSARLAAVSQSTSVAA